MRIVFMGTPDFAVPSLKASVEGGYSVVGVVTQPDRPKGRGKKLAMSPVKEYAIQQGIPVLQPERISRDGYEDLLNLHPDLCVTAAFGQILSQKILDIPPLGTINVHASLLPKHRGSAPIAWAMVQGDKTTGVTTMMTARGIDNGDMLLKAETPIDPAETCGELTARLSEIGAKDGKEGLIVAAGKNAVRVRQLQVPGGKPMDARDYLRGHAMAAGTMLKEDTENE